MEVEWVLTGVLLVEAFFGLLAKGTIAVAILKLVITHKKLTPPCVHMLDKTVGDFLYLISWAIPTVLEQTIQDHQANRLPHELHNSTTASPLVNHSSNSVCPSTYLFPVKVFNLITFCHSVAILTFMSMQRCTSITKPFKMLEHTSSWRSALAQVAILWAISALIGSTIQCCYTFVMCRISQPYPVLLQITFTLCTYLLPLIIIIHSYFKAVFILHKSSRADAMLRNELIIMKRKALAKKMLCLVAIFGFCWMGFNAATITKFALMDNANATLYFFTFAANVVALSNFTLNPLALLLLNETIQESLLCYRDKQKMRRRTVTMSSTYNVERADPTSFTVDQDRIRSESLETVRTDLLED